MRLPLAGVKIERQLIRRLPFDRTYKAITSGILAFSDGMGIRASASGVENMGQLKFLREQGCQLLQGNLIARPMPFVELEQWLPD
jgi:EAL domain-containing protein (putative c-di-GMP-specific phosphodiesterase class I)